MATTDYDFTNTRSDIINRAFEIVGAKTLGESLSGELSTQGVQCLNTLVKSWQSKNIFLWALQSVSQTLSASTASYVLTSNPAIVALDAAYLVLGSNDDRKCELLSWRQYEDLPDKAASGVPTAVAIDNAASPTLYVYPVPTTTYTLKMLAITKLKDWDTASSGADFPVRWERALIYGLANDLKDSYGLPLGERDRIEAKAATLFNEARQGDRDRSDCNFVQGAFSNRRS